MSHDDQQVPDDTNPPESSAARERPEERAATRWDMLAAKKHFMLGLNCNGLLTLNELVFAAWQQLRPEPGPAVEFVRRPHEVLMVPTQVGAYTAPLSLGKSAMTATCNGRLGFYKYDVPEALSGTVRLQIHIRTKEQEPQWGPCFAVSFKPAVRARP